MILATKTFTKAKSWGNAGLWWTCEYWMLCHHLVRRLFTIPAHVSEVEVTLFDKPGANRVRFNVGSKYRLSDRQHPILLTAGKEGRYAAFSLSIGDFSEETMDRISQCKCVYAGISYCD